MDPVVDSLAKGPGGGQVSHARSTARARCSVLTREVRLGFVTGKTILTSRAHPTDTQGELSKRAR